MISVVTSLSTVFDITTYFANNLGIDIDQAQFRGCLSVDLHIAYMFCSVL